MFPSYDGNGMFMSMGNIRAHNKIGLLFIDFENPHRLRVYGEATVSDDDELLAQYKEAQLLVRVKITALWRNCPRYIHKYQKVETSKYVPQASCDTPLPDWKKLDKLQPILPAGDQDKVEQQGGTITLEELQKIEQRDE
jgi:hypothetical protein